MPERLTHDGYQQQLVDLARALGWQHLHVRRSIGKGRKWTTTTNRTGWPDLFLWHPRRGFAAIEVKVGADLPTPDQATVLAELTAAGAVACVAYPADFDRVQAMLQGGAGWVYTGRLRMS